MGSASTITLSPAQLPTYSASNLTQTSADKTSQLLQENHERYHIYRTDNGFHNHIAHQMLTVYALGADPTTIQKRYDWNKQRQWPARPIDPAVLEEMYTLDGFRKYLADGRYYNEYAELFKREIAKKGWQQVLQEYLFARDERAEDMLHRQFAGFMHPIIHVGFGIEFGQPAIIAEGLAQGAVHDIWMKPFFEGTEEAIRESPERPTKSMVELLEQCRSTPSLRDAALQAPPSSNNRIRDGILIAAPDTMIDIVSQYRVKPDEIALKLAEMTNADALLTMAAQRSDKAVKVDFQYMHTINCAIFFPSIMAQTWLADKDKTRLLEWKVWTDIVLYASRGQPALPLEEITNYTPKKPAANPSDPWDELFKRICDVEDDGHAPKLVRALAHGQRLCKPYETMPEFVIKGDMWNQMGHMAVDSVEISEGEEMWVVNTGWDEAWEKIPARRQQSGHL